LLIDAPKPQLDALLYAIAIRAVVRFQALFDRVDLVEHWAGSFVRVGLIGVR